MNVLMTGGTGFFGKAILRRLLANTDDDNLSHMTVLSRNPSLFLSNYPEFSDLPWLDFIQGDILQAESLPDNQQFTHIIHAAADSTLGPQLSPSARYQQIVDGTRNVLNYVVNNNVSRLLLTSSGGVYGTLPPEMQKVGEAHSGTLDTSNLANIYSVAKLKAESLCAKYAKQYGLDYVIGRYFAFVGQDLPIDVHFAIGNFIRDALFAEVITVSGDGSAMRAYMAQEDLALWTLTLLKKGQASNIYNVGSDFAISIKSLAYLVRDLIAPDKPVTILGKTQGDLRNYYVPDISKAKKLHGLTVRVSLEDAILKAANKIKVGYENQHEKQHEETYYI